jgi:hypothetical protein
MISPVMGMAAGWVFRENCPILTRLLSFIYPDLYKPGGGDRDKLLASTCR